MLGFVSEGAFNAAASPSKPCGSTIGAHGEHTKKNAPDFSFRMHKVLNICYFNIFRLFYSKSQYKSTTFFWNMQDLRTENVFFFCRSPFSTFVCHRHKKRARTTIK